MPFTELALPKLRTGPEVKDAFAALWPAAAKALVSEPTIIRAFIGSIIRENESDTEDTENKPILIMEWTTEAAFNNFLTTEAFAEFVAPIKPLAVAPAELQIFDTDSGPLQVASTALMEIIRIQLKEGADSAEMTKATWEDLVKTLGSDMSIMSGVSLNLKYMTFVGTIGWESLKIRADTLKASATRAALVKLRQAGEFSSLLIEVEPFKTAQA